jgi:AcrR family transcriptional regulator
MALMTTRKSTLRKNGIARRQQLLTAARELLETHELDKISLGDVAAAANIPKGSAYHFYEDIKDLYASLLSRMEEELLALLDSPVRNKVRDWQHLVEVLTERGAAFYTASRACTQLSIGPKVPTDLKLHDRQNDAAVGRIYERHLDAVFELPEIPARATIFFRAVEIADLMFSLSVLEHGYITPEMAQEASRAMCAYLRCYLPEKLPRRARRSREAVAAADKNLSRPSKIDGVA